MTNLGALSGRPIPPSILSRSFDDLIEKTDGCWLWRGFRMTPTGYGRFNGTVDGKARKMLAHRMIYEQLVGPIPQGMTLDHLCRNRSCVNPDHMEVVTNRINTLRGDNPCAQNARRTSCVNGHAFDAANTRPYRGGRVCRACDNRRGRAYRARMAS